MDWIQVFTIIASNLALFLWTRTESRADYRALDGWWRGVITEIQKEMKDFHGRLCALEEKNRRK